MPGGETPTTLSYQGDDTSLTADGSTLTITSTPTAITMTVAGVDLGAQAECQLGTGSQIPSGSTNYGFSDTTYSPTQAQILAGSGGSQF